ncbi:uncharacterized protein LOC131151497 [Malania oleifera]|uniref:uncharacterized protein LOC131151497 n=1 Tax=Malania oleifera TaxID=397392 RepID=UPI0025AE86BF|nr:uncharacterized protein LOC131151497 [Malania oleifera]
MSSNNNPVYIEFELEIPDEIPDGDWEAYRDLIDRIREAVAVRTVQSIPVLANEERTPSTWIDINLRLANDSRGSSVWFRTRADNLYLVGYRLHNQQQWFEFSDENGKAQNLIDRSTNLGFSGSYGSLMNRRAGNWEWEDVMVGLFPLRRAIENIYNTERRDRARSLQVVILMINEAIRLNNIRNFFTENTYEIAFPSEFVNHVHGWGNISERVRDVDENADPNMELNIPENSMGIQTLAQAIVLLGIIKDSALGGKRMLLSSVVHRSTTPQGQQLVELFSVTLNGTSGEIYLYGTITVTDGLLSQYIYNRNRNNPEAIYANDTLLLSGPPRSISALDSFTIDVDLLASNDEISYGQGSWNVYLTATNEYDKPLSTDIEGRNGSVRLSYIVFSNAVQATVEVTLVNADGKNTADVFGIITARSDKVSNESMLFWKTSNENNLQVSLNRPVSLLRSAVAVPLDSSLRIRAQLLDRDRQSNSNKEIAHDTVAFPPSLSGTLTRNISGRHGQVQVKVTWKNI